MRSALLLALVLALAGCASDGSSDRGGDMAQAARINTQLGIDYLRQGQLDLAQQKLMRALEQDDDYGPTHTAIAVLYQKQGDLRLAERHYRRALDLDPEDADLHNNFGVFQCGQGRSAEAERYFMQAAQNRRYATPEVAWTNAGMCAKSYDMARAETSFREALRLNPKFPDALAQMAMISFKAGDWLHTRAFIQRYEAVGKPSAELLWIALRTERELGDQIAAHKYEARLRRDYPNSPEAGRIAPANEQ